MEGADLLDLSAREYLCPVCRRLGNTLLPAITPPHHPPHTPLNQAALLVSSTGASERRGEGELRAEHDQQPLWMACCKTNVPCTISCFIFFQS